MPRTTTSRSFAVVLTASLVLAVLGGCSREYEQERLDSDDSRAEQVRRMIAELRSADEAELAQRVRSQAISDLDERQLAALRSGLEQVATAESAELLRLDRFGKDVFRATIELHDAGGSRQLSMLLVPRDDRLCWAKRN